MYLVTKQRVDKNSADASCENINELVNRRIGARYVMNASYLF